MVGEESGRGVKSRLVIVSTESRAKEIYSKKITEPIPSDAPIGFPDRGTQSTLNQKLMNSLKTVRNSVKNWYILLIVGLIFLGTGIYCFVSPAGSFLALALMFGWSFLISGAIEIVFSISNRDELENWGWTLIFGILTFLVGMLLLARPEITMITLAFSLGFLVLFRSIGAISFALD